MEADWHSVKFWDYAAAREFYEAQQEDGIPCSEPESVGDRWEVYTQES